MNNKKHFLILLAIALAVGISFTGGFYGADPISASSLSSGWTSSFHMLPAVLDPSGIVRSNGDTLPPVETYWNVLSRIRSDYYGNPPTEQELTFSAVRGMLKALNDPYTRFLDPKEYGQMQEENKGEFFGIGAQLEDKEGKITIVAPMPDTPAMRAGLRTDDVIVKVDGKPTSGVDINMVVKWIRGPLNTKVTLTIARKGVPNRNYTLTRAKVTFPNVVDVDGKAVTDKSPLVDEKARIGYVGLRQFNEQSDMLLDKALAELDKKKIKGLILDLRGNPGGLLTQAVSIASRFVPGGPAVIIEERGGQRNPLPVDPKKHNHSKVPLVVLVNKGSASASEIVAGAIKDNNAGTLVGTTTFGKGLVQTIMPLADGSAVSITTARYLTPSGIDINRKGIEPDITIQMTEEQAKAKNDVQLKRAVEVMKERLHYTDKPGTREAKKPS